MVFRWLIIAYYFLFCRSYLTELYHRTNYLEVGATGVVTVMERQYVQNHKLKSLTEFERWLMTDYVKYEKISRSASSDQV